MPKGLTTVDVHLQFDTKVEHGTCFAHTTVRKLAVIKNDFDT